MFLAAFLLMLCLALYDLRARSGASEVMGVGLALMALAFSHPMGAAFAFAAVPFLAFAVRPVLVASSAFNVVIALIFPTLFAVAAFTYVSWIFPGDGWSFFAAPAESLSLWTAAATRLFGDGLSGFLTIDASLAMGAALAIGAPIAVVMLALVYRRRPLVVPAVVFAAIAIAATAISVLSGFFGDPTAIVVAAPVLAATVVIRVPVARERLGLATALLLLGWFGGFVGLALVDPITVNYFHAASERGGSERVDALDRRRRRGRPRRRAGRYRQRAGLRARTRPRARNFRAAERAIRARDAVRPHRHAVRRGPGSAEQRRRERSPQQGVSIVVS